MRHIMFIQKKFFLVVATLLVMAFGLTAAPVAFAEANDDRENIPGTKVAKAKKRETLTERKAERKKRQDNRKKLNKHKKMFDRATKLYEKKAE